MSRGRTSRSNTVGPRTSSTGFQSLQPIWFASGSRSSSRPAAPLQLSPARRQPDGDQFFSLELVAKRLELLRELVPGSTRIAVLVNPAHPGLANSTVRDAQAAARAMGLQIIEVF